MTHDDAQLRELVRRFAGLDLAGWDDAAFDRAREHLGWQPARYTPEEEALRTRFPRLYGEEYDTGLGGERGTFARHGADDVRTQISLRVGKGDEIFLALRSLLEEVLGPPSLLRGPGPMLRWRHPVRLLELERFSGTALLRVCPAVAVEKDEYQVARWAEAEDGLGQLGYWQMITRRPEATDLFIPGGYVANDWAELEERLAETLRSVVADFALLDPSSHFTAVIRTPRERAFAQWTTDAQWGLEIQAGIPTDAGPTWEADLIALGWSPPRSPDDKGRLIRHFPVLGREEAETAARLLVAALRSYGVPYAGLSHLVVSPPVGLLGIGLPLAP
ncbi:TY-Chap domain-containing protein [Nonomuraea sp. NPDC050328]|uniref:TY-Chap domain-containing protein n=1 Tax=Nonomuraea sp. NPDC050328 TaxID=3364361 RepID=UPI0037BB63D7